MEWCGGGGQSENPGATAGGALPTAGQGGLGEGESREEVSFDFKQKRPLSIEWPLISTLPVPGRAGCAAQSNLHLTVFLPYLYFLLFKGSVP
jgi:hypothetical protein